MDGWMVCQKSLLKMMHMSEDWFHISPPHYFIHSITMLTPGHLWELYLLLISNIFHVKNTKGFITFGEEGDKSRCDTSLLRREKKPTGLGLLRNILLK